jgi:type III pantothenate kinase
MSTQSILAVNVGNSRTQFARFEGGKPVDGAIFHSLPNDPTNALADAIVAELATIRESGGDPILVACSVNDPVTHALEDAVNAAAPDAEFLRVLRDVPLPLKHTLDDSGERTVGQDRVCDAIGAYAMVNQACVVVDAGSAITVDFVDGEGTFHGGAIAPGVRMMLRALHERTAALPSVEFATPDGAGDSSEDDFQPFGRNTPQAMLNGVYFGARGLVRQLAERYAEKYEAYPIIIATGGDAKVLFESDDLVERIVPELTLRGVAHAFDLWLRTLDDSDAGDPPTEARDMAR